MLSATAIRSARLGSSASRSFAAIRIGSASRREVVNSTGKSHTMVIRSTLRAISVRAAASFAPAALPMTAPAPSGSARASATVA